MADQLALLPGYLTAHLQLALVALLLGAAVSIPTGIRVTRSPRGERIVLGIASVLQTRNFSAVLVGCLAAAALALLLDGVIHAVERGLRDRRRGTVIAALVVLGALYAYTAASFVVGGDGGGAAGATRTVRIGAK